MENISSVVRTGSASIEINKVLKNTYLLLSAALMFSATMAWVAAVTHAQPMGILMLIVGFYGSLFAVHKTANSPWGLFFVFVLTGFMGYSLGPILSMVAAVNPSILLTALGGTGLIFFALSGYVLVTKKDMSFMGGMLTAGAVVLLVLMLASFFINLPAMHLAMSALFMLFSSGMILYETSNIIHGGETNYIRATVSLFVSLYNIFISLLNLLMAFSGDD